MKKTIYYVGRIEYDTEKVPHPKDWDWQFIVDSIETGYRFNDEITATKVDFFIDEELGKYDV